MKTERRRMAGESMTAFVLCLPLLLVTFLSACDLWTLIAAQSRTQSVADAGCRYAVACANAGTALEGTDAFAASGAVHLSQASVVQAALANGYPNERSGQVVGVSVEVSSERSGNATYRVATYLEGKDSPVVRTRSVSLSTVKVKASQDVLITSWPLRAFLGESVVVSRVSEERVPREVIV